MTIKSQSHKGYGFNELRFEDELGQEEVFIHAEKDQNNVVKNNETTRIGNDRSERVEHNETVSIGDNRTEDVGENESISIGANRSVTIGANKTETITLAKTETIGLAKALAIGAGYQRSVGGTMNTTVLLSQSEQIGQQKSETIGNHYNIEAGEEFRIEVGKSVLVMHADGSILINGRVFDFSASGPVKINGSEVDLNVKQPTEPTGPVGPFSGCFSLTKTDNQPYSGYRYKLISSDGVVLEGITTQKGDTEWINTDTAQLIHIHKAVMREDQCITEPWTDQLDALLDAPMPSWSPLDDDFFDQYEEGDS